MSRDNIVSAALKIADEEGLEEVTIRRLAQEIGIGAMTLYGHFRSKEEILDAVADRILGSFTLICPNDATREEVVHDLGLAFLRMMQQHPSIIRLFSSRVTQSRDALQGAMDRVLGRLVASGMPIERAVSVYGAVIVYSLGFATYQSPRPWGQGSNPEVDELRRQRTHFYAGLPRADFPNVVMSAELLTSLPSDEQFLVGLRALARGLLIEE